LEDFTDQSLTRDELDRGIEYEHEGA